MLFKDFILQNATALKLNMAWNNYDLNDVILPVIDDIKNHTITLLAQNYGKFEVSDDIFDEVSADIFMNFPTLLQQLSISRIMVAENVPKVDNLTETLDRTETGNRDITSTQTDTLGTTISQNDTINQSQSQNGNNRNTGTVNTTNNAHNIQDNSTRITNTSGVDMTGSRSVQMSHNMPEQGLGSTGNFPVDTQGTPQLPNTFAQTANQNFSTINPISSNETSNQTQGINSETDTTNLVTNNLINTVDMVTTDTGNNTKNTVNSGSNESDSTGNEDTTNTISETRTREVTNAQYAYEISNFLKEVDTINAFKRFLDNFAWVCGVI